MTTTVAETLMTANELLKLPRGQFRYELLDGVLHTMSPAGFDHGAHCSTIGMYLAMFVLKWTPFFRPRGGVS